MLTQLEQLQYSQQYTRQRGGDGMTDINKIYIIQNKKEVYYYVNV